jgi:hypothetical protein
MFTWLLLHDNIYKILNTTWQLLFGVYIYSLDNNMLVLIIPAYKNHHHRTVGIVYAATKQLLNFINIS